MKTNKLILLGLICLTVAMPTTAQNRNEKKARTERAVKEAIAAKQYKINVDRMQPMRGGSRNLTTNYTLEIRNDSVFSYLPYFGVAYNAPYGGGKSLNFNASITGYTTRALKKGKIQIDFKTRVMKTIMSTASPSFPDGSTSIHVQPMNKQSISFTGEMDTESNPSSPFKRTKESIVSLLSGKCQTTIRFLFFHPGRKRIPSCPEIKQQPEHETDNMYSCPAPNERHDNKSTNQPGNTLHPR